MRKIKKTKIETPTRRFPIRIDWDLEITSRDNFLIYVIPSNRILEVNFFNVISPAIPNDFNLATDLTVTTPIDTSNMLSYELWDGTKLVLPPERLIDPRFTTRTSTHEEPQTDGGSEGIMSKNTPMQTEQIIKQRMRFNDAIYIKFPNFLKHATITFGPIPIKCIFIGSLQIAYVQAKDENVGHYVVRSQG